MKSYAVAALAATAAYAAPVQNAKRAATDADILNYALTLEHLEATFYKEGLQNYTQADFVAAGFADPFYANLVEVAKDEATHVSFLTSALSAAGATPVAACTYGFPATDAKSFVALASVLEGVGVSAYLGAAASIADKDYLTAAGSILTVESRHNAYIRAALTESPFPQPFDDPLSLNEVYTLAAPFFVSCPSTNPSLPVKAFPALSVTTAGPLKTNETITLAVDTTTYMPPAGTPVFAAFITVTGPICVEITSVYAGFSVTVPEGVEGQSYVVLTMSNTSVSDDNTLAGPAIIEIE
ncbi:hypothetical protein SPBR_05176 [Sporothrix brasiliensis 5110]|uniref:Uncharacterized protein n=1 Tax=Sporothrix brasiliensis 5110 TaxID=1398154 RepID=A0A0C2F7K9_9PEZI|nr:uncharacterized protein SPBR_05176 [Sporothrix brasiliensis 5110]KIH87048.1 hypothetical protein SPBR_05176 [Sporothrix brasiliensis 5110]